MTAWRLMAAAWVTVLILAGCGGGGGAGDGAGNGGTTSEAYAGVQPPAPPSPETFDTTRASGTASVTGDTFDPAGHAAGVAVELREILPDGNLGSVQASASTAADGSFSMAMPSGRSSGEGVWMLSARVGDGAVRAYLHPGAVRVDASSEAWVRQVIAARGSVIRFPSGAVPTLREIGRALALYADATGDQRASSAPWAAADRIVQSLSRDHAMSHVVSALRDSGALPASGTGDVGAFYALSDTYAAFFVDDKGQRMLTTARGQFGAQMAADGSWSYRVSVSSLANGQWTPMSESGGDARVTGSRGYERLRGSGTEITLLSNVIGEFASSSLPIQTGTRQLDARRMTSTGLNFTGGSDEQPAAFALNETVGGIETVTLGAGSFRAVRVTNDFQLVVPKSATTISTLLLRSTLWLAPGAGILKEVDEFFIDGVEDIAEPGARYELTSAYANATVWPSLVTMTSNPIAGAAATHYCAPVPIAELRRFMTVESGRLVNSTPRLALALWDMDSGQQIGTTRVFAGNSTRCPVAAGRSASVFVPEAFSERNLLSTWPSDAATATAQSDVVHQVSGMDLADLATFALRSVPDGAQPSLYWPAEIGALLPAPDSSGRFVVGTVKSDYFGVLGRAPQYVQVLGPGVASPIASAGNVLLIGADWDNDRLFTIENVDPFPLRLVPFTTAAGAAPASMRTVRTGLFVPTLWYASLNLLHLDDGRTVRIADGTDGPQLPYTADVCGYGSGTLICLDRAGDRLVKLEADTLVVQSRAELGSFLRGLSLIEPDFSGLIAPLGGIQVVDDSTATLAGQDVHIGSWH